MKNQIMNKKSLINLLKGVKATGHNIEYSIDSIWNEISVYINDYEDVKVEPERVNIYMGDSILYLKQNGNNVNVEYHYNSPYSPLKVTIKGGYVIQVRKDCVFISIFQD